MTLVSGYMGFYGDGASNKTRVIKISDFQLLQHLNIQQYYK